MMRPFGQYRGLSGFGMPGAMLAPAVPVPFVREAGLGPLAASTNSLYGAWPAFSTGGGMGDPDGLGADFSPLAHATASAAGSARGKGGKSVATGIETAMTVSTLASSAGVTGTVGGLLGAAGVSGATGIGIPVGVALGVAAGVVAFVAKMRKGHMSRGEAMRLAKKLGLRHADDVVGWTRRVLQAKQQKRVQMRSHLRNQIARVKRIKDKRGVGKVLARVGSPGTLFRDLDRERIKLLVVNSVIDIDRAAHRGMAPPEGPPPTDIGPFEGGGLGGGLSTYLPWIVGGALLFIVIAAARR